jgi:proton-translocating NADH-quinone oxidoreductase chain L
MSEDPSFPRFISYLSLFTFFMNILVTSGNLVVLFIGWEGVGLCSYLLIGFWYTRFQANKSAMKALVVNRVGDYFILLGIFLVILIFHSTEWPVFMSLCELTSGLPFANNSLISLVGFFLFLGAMAKSAQIGLHTWLPDAMEGPTPVSALIHAATMVTAGVFLLIRCSTLFYFVCPQLLTFITFIGALTALFAATAGLVQNDVKRVIAYSTCSQLGYMVFACGLTNFTSSFFHLFNHAFFKALLFLGAGSVIHTLAGEQDMRRMGGMAKSLPFVALAMFLASLSLAGFPFLSGFYSKDNILESAFANHTAISYFSYTLGLLVAFLTAFYSMRLLVLVFLGKSRAFRGQMKDLHPTSSIELVVLSTLILFSIFSGYIFQHFFTGFGSVFLTGTPTALPNFGVTDFEFIPTFFKIFPTFGSLLGLFLGWSVHKKISGSFAVRRRFYLTYVFFSTKWGFDFIFNYYIATAFFNLSILVSDLIEKPLESFYINFSRSVGSFVYKHSGRSSNVFTFVQVAGFFLLWFFIYSTFFAI